MNPKAALASSLINKPLPTPSSYTKNILLTSSKIQTPSMGYLANIPLPFFLLLLSLFTSGRAATFEIHSNCPYTLWAAASPGGGRRLEKGQSWWLSVPAGTSMARIWGRTKCNFDGAGNGHCLTGDCGKLECSGWGTPPNTLAEYALNQFGNLDFYDISLVDGFNIPMEFIPTNRAQTDKCKPISCIADINGQCPGPMKAPDGCLNPCQVFKTQQYCCTQGPCGPTDYSRFFKDRCRDAYSYPQDDPTSTFTCTSGTDFRVVFCPWGWDPHVPMEVNGTSIVM